MFLMPCHRFLAALTTTSNEFLATMPHCLATICITCHRFLAALTTTPNEFLAILPNLAHSSSIAISFAMFLMPCHRFLAELTTTSNEFLAILPHCLATFCITLNVGISPSTTFLSTGNFWINFWINSPVNDSPPVKN